MPRHDTARACLARPMARTGTARPGLSCPEHDPGQPGPARPGLNRHSLTGFTPHARLASPGAACCRADLGRTVSRAAAAQHAGSRPCSALPTQRLCTPAGRAAGAEAEQARCGGVGPGGSSRKVVVRPGPALDRPYLAPAGHGPARLRKHHHHINTPLPGTRSWAGPCPDRTGSD